MTEIKNLKQSEVIKWDKLEANIFDNGRFFCAQSYNRRYCCVGIVMGQDPLNNPIYKLIKFI